MQYPLAGRQDLSVDAHLAGITADRAAFVSAFLHKWDMALGPDYNLEEELGPIATKAPVWQRYGASLVGDLPTMLRILGGTMDSLVFVPITPCRVVDTRGSGARTRPLVPGSARLFDLTTGGFAKGAGGRTLLHRASELELWGVGRVRHCNRVQHVRPCDGVALFPVHGRPCQALVAAVWDGGPGVRAAGRRRRGSAAQRGEVVLERVAPAARVDAFALERRVA